MQFRCRVSVCCSCGDFVFFCVFICPCAGTKIGAVLVGVGRKETRVCSPGFGGKWLCVTCGL